MTAYTAPGIPKITPSFVSAKKIISVTATYFNVGNYFMPDTIKRRNRKREIVVARQISMLLIRKNTQLSLKSIGSIFGKDHTTVIHSIKTITDQSEVNEETLRDITFINNQLYNSNRS